MIGNIKDHFDILSTVFNSISTLQLDLATQILEQANQNKQTTYMIGNGQSAASASAFALELTKQTSPVPPKHRFRMMS